MTTLLERPEVTKAEPAVVASRRRAGLRRELLGLLFLAPALLVFGLFSWWPIVRGLLISFQETNLVDPAVWVGLENFQDVHEGDVIEAYEVREVARTLA